MLWGKTCTNLGGLLWFQTKTTNIFEHLWCFLDCIESLVEHLQSNLHTPWNFERLQSNFHTPLKVWLKVCSQTFIPPWKFALKVSIKLSYPLEILQWKFQWNFQPNLNYNCSQNAGSKVSVETFKGPWNFHWNFQCKPSGGYESLTANFQSKFQGVWKFDCKLSIKLSYHIEIGIVFPPKDVESLVQTHLHPFGQLPCFLMDEVFAGFD